MRKLIATMIVAASALFMTGQSANSFYMHPQFWIGVQNQIDLFLSGGCWGVCGERIYVENIAPGPGYAGIHNGGSVSYSRRLYCFIC